MGAQDRWTVGEVAAAAHVSVRTLHHYDQIGLLGPSDRSSAGYRLYGRRELERLQQILVYRELGFSLEVIRRMLDEPTVDRRTELLAQRTLLAERLDRTSAVMRAIDRTLASMERGGDMSTEELFEGFEHLGDAPEEVRAHHAEHGREAQDRWGQTDSYAESMRRARRYGKADWEQLRGESTRQEEHMAGLLAAGADPEGEEALAGAEAMRLHIDRWFYPCSPAMHSGLADLYESDARFRAHYEERAEGLAAFVAKAIRANAARAD